MDCRHSQSLRFTIRECEPLPNGTLLPAVSILLTALLLSHPGISLSQVVTNITASGLNTQVATGAGAAGEAIVDITGGTRPGGGPNLFHSFGRFDVGQTAGVNDIANFLNQGSVDLAGNLLPNGLPTSNILARVTDPFPSQIYGTIQTTDFGGANLFLLNPSGILFGPNATLNVGGMATFTTADYLRLQEIGGGNAGIFYADPAQGSLLTIAPVTAFGFLGSNPGAITVQGSQLTMVDGTGVSLIGGNITIQADPDTGTPASLLAPAGGIRLASTQSRGEFRLPSLTEGPNISGQSFTTFGNVSIEQGSMLDASGDTSGTIQIRGGQFVMDNSFLFASSFGDIDRAGDAVRIDVSNDVLIRNQSIIDATSFGAGKTGDIGIQAGDLSLTDGSFIAAAGFGGAAAGNISLAIKNSLSLSGMDAFGNGSLIVTVGPGTGTGGAVTIQASDMTVMDQGIIYTDGGSHLAGAVTLEVQNLTLSSAGSIQTFGFDLGPSGTIKITATGSVTLQGEGDFNTRIVSQNVGSGGTGMIAIEAQNVTLTNGSQLLSETHFNPGGSDTPKISITADSLAISGGSRIDITTLQGDVGPLEISARTITLAEHGLIRTTTVSDGNSGPININSRDLTLSGGSQINSSTEGINLTGRGGDISIMAADTVTLSGSFTDEFGRVAPTAIQSSTQFESQGDAGLVSISAKTLDISDGALIASRSGSGATGDAGIVNLAVGNIIMRSGGNISTSTEGSGAGGNVTIQGLVSPAQSVLIDGSGSGIFTTTEGTGAGGNIFVDASRVTVQNRGTLSASSAGTGDAGNILVNAGNSFTMNNGSVTTEAAQAGGGDIKITTAPTGMVHLTNSTISASVADGPGGGGNISIDPQFVILQNSQILAQAAQGQGGKITIVITNNGLFLPDATSVVNADSGSGVNGTVEIQSPISQAGGKVVPLSNSPVETPALLGQRCAALASAGQYSSFVVAGRDTVPTEPGGWLVSPLALGASESGLAASSAAALMDGPHFDPKTDRAMVSIRRLPAAGTAWWLPEGVAGCGS
jgi:filamentous hemagglutinin family protein